MTLTQQLLIVATLPVSFLLMAVYLWRAKVRRRTVFARWFVTLLLATVWASSVVRFFSGGAIRYDVLIGWGIVGTYAFSLTMLGVLLTTFGHIDTPPAYNRITLGLGILLWVGALVVEPRFWLVAWPDIRIADQVIRPFHLWAGLWVTSWLVPLLAALILTMRTTAALPRSLHRNQINYWVLVLSLFLVGGLLNSIQQQGQPGWQQFGLFISLIAAGVGTYSLTHTYLPDLHLAMRQILSRLSGSLIIFLLALAGMLYLVQTLTSLPPGTAVGSRNFILFWTTALFAGAFTILYRVITNLTQRLFMPPAARQERALADYTSALGNLPEPSQLGQLLLSIVQASLGTDDAWLFTAEDGPQGRLLLRPLASIGSDATQTADFVHDSPIAQHLRHSRTPLIQYDIDTVDIFDKVAPETRQLLNNWQRVLYMPLQAGEMLVGVLALGEKRSGESYRRNDYDLLADMATQVSPLLAQAQNMESLRQINDHVYQENQMLVRESRHLRKLADLYTQFVQLISPDLRRPFASVNSTIQQLEDNLSAPDQQKQVQQLRAHLGELKIPIDNLITLATRIQQRDQFDFQTLRIEDIIQDTMRQLQNMAEARRVRVEYTPNPALPAIVGDANQLQEAVQHLLHNAIKFNKIGGLVNIDCGVEQSDLYLRIIDTGVGIPEQRLPNIWSGLTDISRNGSHRGAGLGLALTRFIVAAHGGRVEVQSNYGSGSTFALYLPLVFEDA